MENDKNYIVKRTNLHTGAIEYLGNDLDYNNTWTADTKKASVFTGLQAVRLKDYAETENLKDPFYFIRLIQVQ